MAGMRMICAVAVVAAVFCACAAWAGGVEPVDWSAWSGKNYTVPADTTNEVNTAADFNNFMNLSRVIFGNDNSAIRFNVSSFPGNMIFKGSGTVIFSEKVLLTGAMTFRHELGEGDENKFMKFIVENGMASNDGVTTRRLYFNPTVFTNAVVSFDGVVTNVSLYNAWVARFDLKKNVDFTASDSFMYRESATYDLFGAIRQQGGTMRFAENTYLGQTRTAVAAYLLEGGSFVNTGYQYSHARYLHFRQTGGLFDISCWRRDEGTTDELTLPSDFVFGGESVANSGFENSTPVYHGSFNLAVMDNASVKALWLKGNGGEDKYRRGISINGGTLTMNTREGSSNIYYAFNGGTLRSTYGQYSLFGNNTANDNPVWVRIYENGGRVMRTGTDGEGNATYLPHLKEPVGNVVWSIPIPDGHVLKTKVWQAPPYVEIVDSTGAGSNALAVADYDFDTGKITNITVTCRGENYSGNPRDVTATLRFKRGEELLEEEDRLVCNVGQCQSGGFTLASSNGFYYAYGSTNTYRGMTTLDIDMAGYFDHPESAQNEVMHSLYMWKMDAVNAPVFASTGLVVRSGCIWRAYYNGTVSLTNYFPNCTRLELYGGHFAAFRSSFKDIVIGGETWLINHNLNASYLAHLTVPADGTLTIDYGAVKTNDVIVTPKLRYGSFTFASGATVAFKGWDELPKGRRVEVLDLSAVPTVNGTPTLESCEDGVLQWDGVEKKLYARRQADGFFLIFK